MKTYMIQRTDTNHRGMEKATTPSLAMVQFMDKYYSSMWGPQIVNGLYELYGQDGTILSFAVQEVR